MVGSNTKRIRITHDVHVESLFLFSMNLVNTHHASRITRMWSRGFKLRLYIRVMRIARLHMYLKMWCVRVLFAEEATQCGSTVAFLHRGKWHLIYLNINVSTSIASAILSQMFPIRMFSLYIFPMNCHIVLGVPQQDWSTSRDTYYHQSRCVA